MVGTARVAGRRLLRGVYWLGLATAPFLGAAAIGGTVFVLTSRLFLEFRIGAALGMSVGLISWWALVRLYRAVVPLPCGKCGQRATPISLNPITIRCGSCGEVEVLDIRILGAS